MKMTTMKPNQVAKILAPSVAELLARKTVAEVEREKATERQTKILAECEYRDNEGNRITDPKRAWTICDEQAEGYYAKCDNANLAAGHDVPAGYCPALMAEENQRQAERSLIQVAEPLTGITFDKLFTRGDGVATHKKYLDLMIGLCLSAK